MSDRELLELAAKAMQATIIGLSEIVVSHLQDREPHFQVRFKDGTYLSRWNPLEDDGDALRLAVAVRADIDICASARYCSVTAHREPDERAYATETPGDSAQSLRRAIVRAAAEIGKAAS